MKVEYVQHMGSDLTVVNAARVSFDKEAIWGWDNIESGYGEPKQILKAEDERLISYLARHDHFTPFTHCTITLRETVPIFVARQRFKHTVGFSYNEVSRRYVDDPPDFYTPTIWRSRPVGSAKQGSGEGKVSSISLRNNVERWECDIDEAYSNFIESAWDLYTSMIEADVAPEMARMVLPQSMYTSYYVTGSLMAFARAYKLRSDPHAQKEIQDVAQYWNSIIRPLYPISWNALTSAS